MRLTDWNSHLLPNCFEHVTKPDVSAEAIRLMSKRGFKEFCFLPAFRTGDSPTALRIQIQAEIKRLKPLLPSDLSLVFGARVVLAEGIFRTDFSPLRLPDGRLAVSLPPVPSDFVEQELVKLVYHLHERILFVSFERTAILYPQDAILRILRLPNASFLLNFLAFSDKNGQKLLKTILSEGVGVSFGTEVNTLEKAGYYPLSDYLFAAKQNLSQHAQKELFNELL